MTVHVFLSNDFDTKPYWNPKSKKVNKSLWKPTFNVLKKLREKSSKTLKNTWFSSKILKNETFNKFDIKPDKTQFTVQPDTNDNFITKTIKIIPRIVINQNGNTFDQQKIIERWFGIARLYYNRTIHYLQNNDMISFYSLRKIIMEDLNNKYEYVKNAPSLIS
jgi:hypothetical protein